MEDGPGWKDIVKQLAVAIGKGVGAGIGRVVLAVVFGFFLNALCGVGFFAANHHFLGTGHGALTAVVIFVLAPMLVMIALLGAIAYKQALQGIFARALESQAQNLAFVGSKLIDGYLMSARYQGVTTRLGRAFTSGMQRYLKARTETPKLIRWTLGFVIARVPLGEVIDDLAMKGVPANELPREAMSVAMLELSRSRLRPSWGTLGLVAIVEVLLWTAYAAIFHWFMK